MATYRIGIGSFSLAENGGVGIGTDSAGLGNLRVEGTFKTTDLDITTGIATFTRYAGFAADNIGISSDIVLSGEHQTIGDIVVGLNSTFTVSTGATVTVGTVESVSIGTHFSPPIGGVEDRPEVPVEGTVRFNEDLNTLEFYNGVEWRQFTVYNSGTQGRTVFAGGGSPTESPSLVPYMSGKIMDYVQIASKGNAVNFGELTQFSRHTAGGSNRIRGLLYHGSATPGNNNVIDKITIASQGNATSFGLIDGTDRWGSGGAATDTRAIFDGGATPTNDIDYVEIMTDGNSISFGDLTAAKYEPRCCNDPVRVLVSGGNDGSVTATIETFMMASKGNAVDYGDMTAARSSQVSFSNSTRGINGQGLNPARIPTLESITIASGGNGVYFGDVYSGAYGASGASQTRGLIGGGTIPGTTYLNTIEYVTISTLGTAEDFGELSRPCYGTTGLSDSHGGLGGY